MSCAEGLFCVRLVIVWSPISKSALLTMSSEVAGMPPMPPTIVQ